MFPQTFLTFCYTLPSILGILFTRVVAYDHMPGPSIILYFNKTKRMILPNLFGYKIVL